MHSRNHKGRGHKPGGDVSFLCLSHPRPHMLPSWGPSLGISVRVIFQMRKLRTEGQRDVPKITWYKEAQDLSPA